LRISFFSVSFKGRKFTKIRQGAVKEESALQASQRLVGLKSPIRKTLEDPQIAQGKDGAADLSLPEGRGEVRERIRGLRGNGIPGNREPRGDDLQRVATLRSVSIPGITLGPASLSCAQKVKHPAGDGVGALLLEVGRGEELLLHGVRDKEKL